MTRGQGGQLRFSLVCSSKRWIGTGNISQINKVYAMSVKELIRPKAVSLQFLGLCGGL